ncbi:MAG: PaaI family thioesterase [Acidobacteria bacterium]|nr:PaaI family thioesterase [Acidobacteriota bacterium]
MIDKERLLKDTANNELFRFLGIKVVEAVPERVVLEMEVTPKVHQYTGVMNGGVSVLLAESAASIGVVVGADLEKVTPVGIEINANHLRAVSKGLVTAVAAPIHTGKTLSVWKIEITDQRGKLVCTSRITLLNQKRAGYRPPDPSE